MANRKYEAISLPLALADLTLASCETVARRMLLISQNQCSQAEYLSMFSEKAEAAMATGLTLMFSYGQASVASLMAPWLSQATANLRLNRYCTLHKLKFVGVEIASRYHQRLRQRLSQIHTAENCIEFLSARVGHFVGNGLYRLSDTVSTAQHRHHQIYGIGQLLDKPPAPGISFQLHIEDGNPAQNHSRYTCQQKVKIEC